MKRIACLVLQLTFVCQSFHGVAAKLPKITPDAKEIVVEEGEELRVSCFAEGEEVHFSFPNVIDEEVTQPEIRAPTTPYEAYTLIRPKATRSDTGWYGCAKRNIEIRNDDELTSHESQDVAWIYVYVNSTEPFSESHNYFVVVAVVEHPAVLPCHPTSPKLNATCSINPPHAKVTTRFVPKVGCVIENFSLSDHMLEFTCSAEGYSNVNTYMLYIQSNDPLPMPSIKIVGSRHVVWGQDLRVNCTVESPVQGFAMIWSYPASITEDRVQIQSYSVGPHRFTKQLIVKNVTKNDEGRYNCCVKTSHDSTTNSKTIHVYDPSKTYIELKMQRGLDYFERKEGLNVQWVVQTKAYPRPRYTWYGPNGEELCVKKTKQAKYTVFGPKHSRVTLKIRDLKLSDSGTYMLLAQSKFEQRTINVTLKVRAKPEVKFQDYRAESNGKVNIVCQSTAFPRPDISWSFENCATSPCLKETKLASDAVTSTISEFEVASRLTTTLRGPGRLVCRSCNDLGCRNIAKKISITGRDKSVNERGKVEAASVRTDLDTSKETR